MKNNLFLLSALVFLLNVGTTFSQSELSVNIRMDKEIGMIRAVNGGQLSPVCNKKLLNLTEEFKSLNIPSVRLHDAPWANDNVVDIHMIFRDFRLDPADENNYDFRQTDVYISEILETGTQIIFRLGESIEHTEEHYFVNPPTDFEKWAEICCGIIRHYNHGWANGFHHNIKFWEIWNEPDGTSTTWNGTEEQFFSLYGTAAKAIKKEFPNILVGGPSVATPVINKNNTFVVRDFTKNFLTYCKIHSIPLDFFSWHNYNLNPWDLAHRATYVRDILNQYGFDNTQSHLNEWNYVPGNNWSILFGKENQGKVRRKGFEDLSNSKGASFVANVLMLLQDEPIDVANFYTTTVSSFGIFSEYGEPRKTYYAFKAFAELLATPNRIETKYNKADSIVVCSGKNKEETELTILSSNFSSQDKMINFELSESFHEDQAKIEIYLLDELHDLSKTNEQFVQVNNRTIKFSETIPSSSVLLIKLVSN
jgi:xylan 1,4-beta-xylosidase